MSKVKKQDRGLQVMAGRMWAARVAIAIYAIGMLVWLGVLVFDIYYSYEGSVPVVVNPYMAVIVAVATTPLEAIGWFLLSTKEHRKELGQVKVWVGIALMAVAYLIDIITNWMGMIADMTGGSQAGQLTFSFAGLTDLQVAFVLGVGTMIAFIENLIDITIRALIAEVKKEKEAKDWLIENGYIDDEDASSRYSHNPVRRRPSRSRRSEGPSRSRRPSSDPSRRPSSDHRPSYVPRVD